jgi:nicotinamidase-related amidase
VGDTDNQSTDNHTEAAEPGAPVLVLIDLQDAIDDPIWGPRNNPEAEDKLRHLLDAWRHAEAPVIHIRHDSIDPHSPYRPGQPGNAFKVEVTPLSGETIIAKQTNSAFIGTALEEHLRRAGHMRVVMAGVLTSNSLEATARHSGNLGFETYVVADCCWAVEKTDLTGTVWRAEDVHNLSLAHLHGEYAEVVETAAALALLMSATRGTSGR